MVQKYEPLRAEYQAKKDEAAGLKESATKIEDIDVKWTFASPLDSALILAGNTLVAGGKGEVICLDAESGKLLWTQEKAGGLHASPVAWAGGGRKLILVNGKNLAAVDPSNGAIVWTAPAGGDSTPAIRGDLVVVQSFTAELGLVAYRIKPEKAEKVWNFPYPGEVLRTQSSPVIFGQHVYLFDDNNHYCLNVETGEKVWFTKSQSTISSPAVADGKLFALTNNANTLVMLATGTTTPTELGRATVRAQWIPSPCIADGQLVLRLKDKVKAWSLAK